MKYLIFSTILLFTLFSCKDECDVSTCQKGNPTWEKAHGYSYAKGSYEDFG